MRQLRGFETMHAHNQFLVDQWNCTVTQPDDQVYMLGDICWNRSAFDWLPQLNGQKYLVMGNHDTDAKRYLPYVNRLFGAIQLQVMPGCEAILTHIPVHPTQLEDRFQLNIHGHLHTVQLPDRRYVNVCVEPRQGVPMSLADIQQLFNPKFK